MSELNAEVHLGAEFVDGRLKLSTNAERFVFGETTEQQRHPVVKLYSFDTSS